MGKIVVAAVLLTALGAGAALASVPTPSLRAEREHDGNVRVRWSWSGTVERSVAVLEIERVTPATPLAEIARPRRRGNRLDDAAPASAASYRARLVVDGVASAWSGVATADVVTPPPGDPDPSGTPCAPDTLDAVLALVNDARHQAGVPALAENARLDTAADRRSEDIAAAGQLTHDGWITAIRNAGYTGGVLGENIAMGYATPGSVVSAWLASGPHRANILNPYFRDSGIGCTLDRNGRAWWAHDFGG